ncbi:hypothetical protein PAMP_005914 [Pampus punctatissimus]
MERRMARPLGPYLGSLLPILDPKNSRVWLQKILYVWRRRGRQRAETHSELTVHRKKRSRRQLNGSVNEPSYLNASPVAAMAATETLFLPVASVPPHLSGTDGSS